MSRRVLAVAVHPDDETLGCGGSLLKHQNEGDSLYWLILTRAWEPRWSKEAITQKQREVERVTQAYGFKECFWLEFPSTRLETVPMSDIVEAVRKVVTQVGPEWVYVVNGTDIHTDHQIGFQAVMSVLKPLSMAELGVWRVLAYETLSETEAAPPSSQGFVPNVFSDITPYLEGKLEIMRLYETEVQPAPQPRSPEALRAIAGYRGATMGVKGAEAFMLIRERV